MTNHNDDDRDVTGTSASSQRDETRATGDKDGNEGGNADTGDVGRSAPLPGIARRFGGHDAYDELVHHATQRALAHLATHDAEREAATAAGREIEALDPFHAIRHVTRRAWLRAFALCGNKTRAARAVGIDRTTPYSAQWQEDAEFMAALPVAEKLAADLLEEEATRRAMEGTVKAVGWYKGEPGGYEREYSDTLLAMLLKANAPDKFGDRLKLSGGLANMDVSQWPDEAVDRVARGEHPFSVLASLSNAGALPPGRDLSGEGTE